MCGRYGLKLSIDQVVAAAEALDVPVDTHAAVIPAWHADGDIAPTDAAPIVVMGAHGAVLAPARWGIQRPPRPGAKGHELVINARCETATERPLFRPGRPALVPASGWYEWPADTTPASAPDHHDNRKGVRRHPMWLSRSDEAGNERVIWFAALAFSSPAVNDATGPMNTTDRFVIATRPPVDAIASVHDRMPALVPPDMARAWLQLELSPADLCALSHADLRFRPVPPRPPRTRASARTTATQLDLFGPSKPH